MHKNAAIVLAAVLVLAVAAIVFLMFPGKIPTGVEPTNHTNSSSAVSSIMSSASSSEEQANIVVTQPKPHDTIGATVTIVGRARVFENQFSYRVLDADGTILLEGHALADAPDIGQFGSFSITTPYTAPKGTTGWVEVFEYSAKDGSEINKVRIPITFSGR